MAVSAVLLATGLTACGATKGDSNAGDVERGPANVIAFPDGFRNVAHKCDGPNMVYSTSRGAGSGEGGAVAGSVAVVPGDPRCR